jgi:RNase H-like domain found in reverse transcriptase
MTRLSPSKATLEWLPTHQQEFEIVKKVVRTEIHSFYPNSSKPFQFCTYASDHQVGAVIMHDEKPIAFYL